MADEYGRLVPSETWWTKVRFAVYVVIVAAGFVVLGAML